MKEGYPSTGSSTKPERCDTAGLSGELCVAGALVSRKAMERECWRRSHGGLMGRQWRIHRGCAVEK